MRCESGKWWRRWESKGPPIDPNWTTSPHFIEEFVENSGPESGTRLDRDPVPCVLWSGRLDRDGYGLVPAGVRGRYLRAHRVEWAKRFGPIPSGMCILHTCDEPACVEIQHLKAGTHQQNMADRDRKRRQAVGERNGRALLSEAQVLRIRRMRKAFSRVELARIFGVSLECIYSALRGENWRHLPFPEPVPPKPKKSAPRPAPRPRVKKPVYGRPCRKCGRRIEGSIGTHFAKCKEVPC